MGFDRCSATTLNSALIVPTLHGELWAVYMQSGPAVSYWPVTAALEGGVMGRPLPVALSFVERHSQLIRGESLPFIVDGLAERRLWHRFPVRREGADGRLT